VVLEVLSNKIFTVFSEKDIFDEFWVRKRFGEVCLVVKIFLGVDNSGANNDLDLIVKEVAHNPDDCSHILQEREHFD